jgi:hypothetical protein
VELARALDLAMGNLEVPAHYEVIDTLRRWKPFIEAALSNYAKEAEIRQDKPGWTDREDEAMAAHLDATAAYRAAMEEK